ncbi:hypothetical protein [Streptomyces sp. SAJ15]|uniref:hypothetical protein n=1 Tax=Streptomyces sp. SAJ15 TaxID=2011095 RepID=UPI001186AB00|nr:hypothetical protein [Streptomyces sp. SAJ15]TVL90445.1 hypothetical protein CD790_20880 [Streptomyces sp. SAJ15]
MDLAAGLAVLIADDGLAVFRPDGVHAAGDTGMTIAVLPNAPDHILATLFACNRSRPLTPVPCGT